MLDELALAALQSERLRVAARARLVRAARHAGTAARPTAPGTDPWDVVLAGFARASAAR